LTLKEIPVKSFFDRLRHKKTKISSAEVNINTVPLSDQQIQDVVAQEPRIEPSQLVCGAAQSTGKQRDHNEDCLFTFSVTIGGGKHNYPLGLYIVADGMGGHQYGEVASSTAVRTMAGYLLKRFHPYITNPAESFDEPLQDLMRAAINEAQRAVMQAAPGSGTTVTAALILGQQMTIGHVGDSRAYAIRSAGRIDTLTRDHSLVKRLEELGQISSEEAAAHPQRNVLYRALGQGEVLEPDIFTSPFPQPGYLFLCSDGLWGVVSDDEICRTVSEAPNLQAACQSLVAAANEAGGPDNITAVVIQLIN
jgi:serine/threonine protein phosphatase PrpC